MKGRNNGSLPDRAFITTTIPPGINAWRPSETYRIAKSAGISDSSRGHNDTHIMIEEELRRADKPGVWRARHMLEWNGGQRDGGIRAHHPEIEDEVVGKVLSSEEPIGCRPTAASFPQRSGG
uniref:Uncharacterized protein n=1 Tax=Cannabis sativa TaxID=3483 RepID=A0A803PHY4_CANSA